MSPLEIIRVKDKLFKALGYSKKDKRSKSEWLRIIFENPKLLDRPIVKYKNNAVLARPPEKALDILP